MSSIIKATDRDRGIHPAAFNMNDLRAEADRQLQEIRAQAEGIITQARKQAEAVKKQAQTEGQQLAQKALSQLAATEAAKRLETLFPALRQAIGQLDQVQQHLIGQWEQRIIRLACAIAERVIRRELAQTPDITLDLVREGLQLAAGAPQLRLLLNPADQAQLSEQLALITKEFNRLGPTEIVADPRIELGGCRIETSFGSIDQQFSVQLARIASELA
ncbi:MAG: hypothetical protein K1X74_22875 [Pirellulales bacterium]|nr:hypothetical protein [Pirellulales bacterium]